MEHSAQKHEHSKGVKPVMPDFVTLVRLAITVILLVLAYNIGASQLVAMIMLIAAILISGFDIAITAVYAVLRKDFFNNSCLVLIAAAASFAVGCYVEATVFVIIYQACRVFMEYAEKRTKQAAAEDLPKNGSESFSKQRSLLNRCDGSINAVRAKIEPLYSVAVMAVTAIAVLFAALMPLITDMSYVMSIRRGAMLIVAIIPASAFASLSLCTAYGLCRSAAAGVIIDEPETIDKAAKLKTIVFDKSDVLAHTRQGKLPTLVCLCCL